MSSTPIFTVAGNLSFGPLNSEMHWDFRKFEADLNDPEKEAPRMPPLPCLEDMKTYNKVLVNFVRDAAIDGAVNAGRLNHDPYAPHMPQTARPGTSVFFDDSADKIIYGIDPNEAVVSYVSGGKGVRLFVVNTFKEIGTETTCPIYNGYDYTMVETHGSLMPKGKTTEETNDTTRITFVFTYEGEDIGWVLASVHPGTPDPTPDKVGLKEGDVLDFDELTRRNFVRAIPE